jgi:leucyl-tRNA synthetase
MVLAPEHPLVEKLTTPEQHEAVHSYIHEATRQTDIEREALDKEKTGIFTGGYAINPVNDERIPVWIADYVLMTYGTGAIMAVPAHDQRDFEFARKFEIDVIPVILPEGIESLDGETMTEALPEYGVMINSGSLTGTSADDAFEKTNAYLEKKGTGKFAINYRLHDWLISRQRYWGAPIPVVYCPKCGIVPIPEDQLPVELPDDIEWRPTGESPLKFHPTWKSTVCPECDEPAERETDTMDTFMCSSWYHLRYLSPEYAQAAFDQEEYDYWMPVDTYTGGVEHATMHLIYTRFFHKTLRDMGVAEGHEPMLQLRNQGQILGPDGQRMSKSRGNVIDPDEQVSLYGADAVRAYLMFGYRWSEGGVWNPENIQGVVRWLNRVWMLILETRDAVPDKVEAEAERVLLRKTHQTIRQLSHDIDNFEFNTVISGLMELTNQIASSRDAGLAGSDSFERAIEALLLMMAPPTPHIAEELWARMDKPYSIHNQPWPEFDPELAKEDEITLVIQVNGKVRDRITAAAGISDDEARKLALASEAARRFIGDKKPHEIIVVPGRLVNIVV